MNTLGVPPANQPSDRRWFSETLFSLPAHQPSPMTTGNLSPPSLPVRRGPGEPCDNSPSNQPAVNTLCVPPASDALSSAISEELLRLLSHLPLPGRPPAEQEPSTTTRPTTPSPSSAAPAEPAEPSSRPATPASESPARSTGTARSTTEGEMHSSASRGEPSLEIGRHTVPVMKRTVNVGRRRRAEVR